MELDIFWAVAELSCLTSRLSDSRFVIDLDTDDTTESWMRRKQDCYLTILLS